ncbi:MAG: hypothetical protein M1831_003775 [Alyxoria varia]|nr:MAG: hypothetical protein M1831_003775 [Alyxoria varia]
MDTTLKRKSDDEPARSKPSKTHKSKREGGIRWKEKPRKDPSREDRDASDPHIGQRHDRQKPPKKPSDLPPSPPPPEPQPSPPQTSAAQPPDDELDISSKFGVAAANKIQREPGPSQNITSEVTDEKQKTKDKKPKDKKRQQPPAQANEPMMEVIVNDRLGSKSRVPCLGSDTVRDFKKLVAMQIGRKPHEIMIKRQGERPFKDILTLADYGVSSGVQLDLELDTGD